MRALILMAALLLSACANVKPWEKAHLAKPAMALSDDAQRSQLSSHVYFAKESSSGGDAAAGGGCGCN
jgi:hypothetical protein